jgi:hypothetical protein
MSTIVITANTNGLKVGDSHNIDWTYQNKLREQWLIDNPQAVYIGWTSI